MESNQVSMEKVTFQLDALEENIGKLSAAQDKLSSEETGNASLDMGTCSAKIEANLEALEKDLSVIDSLDKGERAERCGRILLAMEAYLQVAQKIVSENMGQGTQSALTLFGKESFRGILSMGKKDAATIAQEASELQKELLLQWVLALYALAKRYKKREFSDKAKQIQEKWKSLPKLDVKKLKRELQEKKKTYVQKSPQEIVSKDLVPLLDRSVSIMESAYSCLDEQVIKITSTARENLGKAQNISMLYEPVRHLVTILQANAGRFTQWNAGAVATILPMQTDLGILFSKIETAGEAIALNQSFILQNAKVIKDICQFQKALASITEKAKHFQQELETKVVVKTVEIALQQALTVMSDNAQFVLEYTDWWGKNELEQMDKLLG
ncbi:MAG TPA: hypothetical protein P5560_10705 [Thermotogota bacterium]|nr:hypothetical protein [Thermotogota bacterium]HRW93407.1 hypothetical protein [Thermotogota bacterium]